MSNTRGVRRPIPPPQEPSKPQGQPTGSVSSPQKQTSGTSGSSQPISDSSTGDRSTVRGARQTSVPQPPPQAAPPPPIKTIDQYLHTRPKGSGLSDAAILVRLKSDDEGVNQSQRDAHMKRIQELSQPYVGGSGTAYTGIETKLESLFPAYIGNFHPNVVKEINAAPEVSRVEKNQAVSFRSARTTPTWGPARVLETDASFKEIASRGPTLWPYDTTVMKGLGKGVTIHIIDGQGFLPNDFKENEDRLVYTEGGDDKSHTENRDSHATLVANIAGGNTFGMAPEANISIYSNQKSNGLEHLIAMERLSKTNLTGYNILNLSWGLPVKKSGHCWADALEKLMRANVIPVVAAENNGEYFDSDSLDWPANASGVIVVGNSDKDNKKYHESNYGPNVDVFAPGTDIPIKDDPEGCTCGFIANLLSTEGPGKHFTVNEIRAILRNSYSRETDTYEHNGEKFPIRTIVARAQNTDKPVPTLVPAPFIEPEKRVLNVSIVDSGYYITVPLDEKPHFADQRLVESLFQALERKSQTEYAMILKNALVSTAIATDSFKAIEQIRFEYADGSSAQEARFEALMKILLSLKVKRGRLRKSITSAVTLAA